MDTGAASPPTGGRVAPEQAKSVGDKYNVWYEAEYAKCVHLSNLTGYKNFPFLRKWVESFQYQFSSIWRHECLSNMRYFAMVRKDDYTVTTFNIHRRKSPKSEQHYRTTYAFMYSHFEDGKPVMDYISTGPTFKSMDGEYRHRFITWHQFISTYEARPDLAKVEEYLQGFIDSGELSLSYQTRCPEPSPKEERSLNKTIDRTHISLRTCVIAWSIDYDRYVQGRLENHLAEGYREALIGTRTQESTAIARAGNPDHQNADFIRYKKSAKQTVKILELGQKLIPLSVIEVEQCRNIRHGPWREVYVATRVNDLVINGISPCFPIFNDWFFLTNSDQSLYDNVVNHVRAKFSDQAEEIVRRLESIRRETYLVDPVRKKELYLSYNMEGLSDAIEIPVEYAESEMVLSPIALVTLTEHMGRTLGDLLALMEHDAHAKATGPIFSDYRCFSKHIFEYVYSIWCLNSRLGAIHSDLHLNNATIYQKRHTYNAHKSEYKFEHPRIIYQVRETLYAFPHYGSYSCIIDFSRALLGREHLQGSFPPAEVLEILEDQKRSILKTYARDLPDFHRDHRVILEQALIINYDAVHRLFEAIDVYKIAVGWIHLVRELLGNPRRLAAYGDRAMLTDRALPLVERLRQHSLAYLTVRMQQLAQNPIPKKGAEIHEHPVLQILTECFGEHVLSATDHVGEVALLDYQCSENPLTYSTQSYEQFPPTVKLDYVRKHRVPGEMEAIDRWEHYEDYLEAHPVDDTIETIVREAVEARAERRDLPEDLRPGHTTPDAAKKQKVAVAQSANDLYYES
jgi:hypothetical protein